MLILPAQSPYLAFSQYIQTDESSPRDISIDAVLGSSSVNEHSSPVFQSESTWRMAQLGDSGYRISFRLRHDTPYDMVVYSDILTRNVKIFVSPQSTLVSLGGASVHDPFTYPVDQLLLMNHLAFRRGFIVHSAGFVVDGVGFVLPGVSGAGKSTISRLFAAEGLRGMERLVLSDDRIIVREIDGCWTCWGTPWPGDAGYAENVGVPLKALMFLHKAGETRITPLAPGQAARRLFPTISCPWYDKDRLPHVLETCEHLLRTIPAFEFAFTPDQRAIEAFTGFVCA